MFLCEHVLVFFRCTFNVSNYVVFPAFFFNFPTLYVSKNNRIIEVEENNVFAVVYTSRNTGISDCDAYL